MELLIFIACVAVLIYGYKIWDKANSYDEIKSKVDALDSNRQKLDEDIRQLDSEKKTFQLNQVRVAGHWDAKVADDKELLKLLAKQKTMGFPWLATAYADFFALEDKKLEQHLKSKKHPAHSAAEAVKEAGQRRREAEFKQRLTRYKIEYYEALFPWLSDLIAENEGQDQQLTALFELSSESKDDAASHWLTAEEFAKLPSQQKYQKALERYASRKKTAWEIGRDYERFIGYVWERKGYSVAYDGALEGFEDMGRDLIAVKDETVEIIQCKYWSQHKTIHEKHIFQLFGTTIEYWMSIDANKNRTIETFIEKFSQHKVVPVFVTSTALSDKARKVAKALNVVVHETYAYGDYPRIKCNISGNGNEKIYHLPFDQQYDRVIIKPSKAEFYATTIAEAESKGFRRAFRWRG